MNRFKGAIVGIVRSVSLALCGGFCSGSRLSAFDIGTSGNEVEKGVSACSVVAAVVCVSGFFDGPGSNHRRLSYLVYKHGQ